jgi:hypothetical protein
MKFGRLVKAKRHCRDGLLAVRRLGRASARPYKFLLALSVTTPNFDAIDVVSLDAQRNPLTRLAKRIRVKAAYFIQ